jgi:hypothetical protein
VAPEQQRVRRADTPSSNALRLAIAHPGEVLGLLHPVLFDDPAERAALAALVAADGDLHRAVADADPLVGELLARLAVEDCDADPSDVRRLLLREGALVRLHRMQELIRQPEGLAQHGTTIGWLKNRIEAVGPDAPSDPESEAELLGWLAHEGEEDA